MGIMSFLRNRLGVLLVIVIGFSLVAFLVSIAFENGMSFMQGDRTTVAEIAGKTISYDQFNARVEQNMANFKNQMGGANVNAQMTSYIVENTWNQTVTEALLEKELARLGIQVSDAELNDMLTGKNPHQQVMQAFGNPQTGQFDRNQLTNFLSNVQSQPEGSDVRKQWNSFLLGIQQDRLNQKYYNLVKNSVYVTTLEAKEDYNQRNKLASFKYVSLDYASIPDNKVTLTDEDYKSYYNEHKNMFKNPEETRTFEYVVFDANPSKADSAEVKAKVQKLAADFRTSTNDSMFVSVNSDTKAPVAFVGKGQLDPALDSLVFSAGSGAFIGPVFSNGSYKMAKVLAIQSSPDSVKASHILIDPTKEGGVDKAKAKADSIYKLIQGGASFADLASKFGTDGTKDKGGDLGMFARGAMVGPFEDAVFNGSTGDLKVITTQFGVHVIKITAQKGSSKRVKVAVVDKVIGSSSKTQQEAYAKATSFLSAASDAKAFDEEAKRLKYNKLIAENVTGSQGFIAGLENARAVIQWAYGADKGDVGTQIFETGNKFVVAKLTRISKKGILPLEDVKKQIEPMVRNTVKAKQLIEKMNTALAGASRIEQVAQKLGKPVMPVQNIVFANPILPALGQENKVVGTIFGLQPGKLSKAIEGSQGVFAVVVDGFSNPAPLANVFKQKEQIAQSVSQRSTGEAFRVLREKSEIKDNRVKFY